MIVIRSHDALFRFVFGEPEQMAELLRSNLPAEIASAIDWGALRQVGGTFVDPSLQERHADLLFETRIGDGPLLLYVLVEHKSTDDPLTAFQVLRYVLRVHDSWLRSNPGAKALPPVLPVVVHHGDRPWSAVRSVRSLVDVTGLPDDVASYVLALQPDLEFVLDDLATATEDSLEARRLSAVADLSLRFLQFLRHVDEDEATRLIPSWELLLRALLAHRRGRDVLEALLSWHLAGGRSGEQPLRAVMARIHDSEVRQTMKSALDDLLEQGREQGLEQGREQGLEQGREQGLEQGREEGMRSMRELVRRLLGERFGPLAAEIEARVAKGSPADLETWAVRTLTASSVADVLRER